MVISQLLEQVHSPVLEAAPVEQAEEVLLAVLELAAEPAAQVLLGSQEEGVVPRKHGLWLVELTSRLIH